MSVQTVRLPSYEESMRDKYNKEFIFKITYQGPKICDVEWGAMKVLKLSYVKSNDYINTSGFRFMGGLCCPERDFYAIMRIYGVDKVVWTYAVKAEIEIKLIEYFGPIDENYNNIDREYARAVSFEEFFKKYIKYEYLGKWKNEESVKKDEWLSKFGKWLERESGYDNDHVMLMEKFDKDEIIS